MSGIVFLYVSMGVAVIYCAAVLYLARGWFS